MRLITGVLLLMLAGCAGPTQSSEPSAAPPSVAASAPAGAADVQARVTVGTEGAPLGYLEYLPAGHGDGEPRPLLVFLHGAGEAGDGSEAALELVDDIGIPQLIAAGEWPDDRPFVVLSPQYGTDRAESDCAVADDVAAFLDFAVERYEVDPARVYLTGISCGAIGLWDYLAVHGDEVAAAAVPVSGHAEWALEKAGCPRLAEVPVWAFHGGLDDIVPTVHIEGPMDAVTECYRPDPSDWKLTVYPDADHISAIGQTYDLSAGHDIYAWLLGHTNNAAP